MFDVLKFISMKTENLELKDSIKKVGDDYIFLFDIDDTLYKSSYEFKKIQLKSYVDVYNNLRDICGNRDIPPVSAGLIENSLYSETFSKYFNISPIQLESLRKQIAYKDYLGKEMKLRKKLLSIPFRKWAFTNCVESRARPILKALGLTDCFEGVICIDDDSVELIGKPKDSAFEFVEEFLGIENKQKVFFFDDALANIKTGERFGWRSFHVRKKYNIIDLLEDTLKLI
ncbi:hypothetical protein NGRA_1277 [Nosema granulosis]|uniref:Pyrimidine 5-nucleotidase n=1 Tax=Nosema granulosis TaxID=83296 RepID=A0A9P6GZ92_9MICR|nr:hypothetical protein NGRA_1277 [Nosema granulosis]